jgi:hypothetical protein
LVLRASPAATPTRWLVRSSWRLISSIDPDSSLAADAAFSTLADASFEVLTALSARCEVCRDAENSVEAVDRIEPA